MIRILALLPALMVASTTGCLAQFSGTFELGPAGCEQTGRCTLTYDFKYKDPKGEVWQAAAQNKTDGASIPPWAQPIVGDPFDKSFIKAAVIHDHYCDRHVRSWRATHRVFFDALLEQGVAPNKAKLMYFAVYLGGPKWVELIPGRPCGNRCVFKVEIAGETNAPGAERQFFTRAAGYDDPDFSAELTSAGEFLEKHGDRVTLEILERRAEKARPDDYFYKNGDRVTLGGAARE